jgi:signal transduction histidine kinase
VPYDAAVIIQAEKGVMKGRAMRGFVPQVKALFETNQFQLANGAAAAQIITMRKPVLMNFPRSDGLPFNEIPGFEAHHHRMGIPITVQDEVIGFLLLIKREPDFYTQRHVDRMMAFSSHVSSAYLNAQLFERQRELLKQVVLAQEEERKRVAGELHDEAGQALTAVTMNLQLLRGELDADSDMGSKIDNLIQLTHATAGQIRGISYGLRPPLIDMLGLNLALEDLCREVAERSKIEIKFAGQELLSLSDAINITLYRILQESLTNVLRHAEATQIIVTLSATRTHVFLSISDNGKGFIPVQVGYVSGERRGLGLLGMRERADLINGRLEINSSLGKGTQIQITVPKG